MDDLIRAFADLFEGRQDAYGTETGGCLRTPNGTPSWLQIVEEHLDPAHENFGVYPLTPNTLPEHPDVIDRKLVEHYPWIVKWGCVDLDVKAPGKTRYDFETTSEAMLAARNLVAVLDHFGITGWIEQTKSGGMHVWVFAADWVPAGTMRRALLFACQIGEVPTTEVNPKSEGEDDPSFLGNYVRLPYPGMLQECDRLGRRTMRDGLTPIGLEEFLDLAMVHLATISQLATVAQMWTPPVQTHTILVSGDVTLDEALRRKLSGLVWKIVNEGPLDGSDRSGTLARLAFKCFDDNLSPDEALAVLTAADENWGKFSTRPDGQRRLASMVERAYA
jgi:hypothetical protein